MNVILKLKPKLPMPSILHSVVQSLEFCLHQLIVSLVLRLLLHVYASPNDKENRIIKSNQIISLFQDFNIPTGVEFQLPLWQQSTCQLSYMEFVFHRNIYSISAFLRHRA